MVAKVPGALAGAPRPVWRTTVIVATMCAVFAVFVQNAGMDRAILVQTNLTAIAQAIVPSSVVMDVVVKAKHVLHARQIVAIVVLFVAMANVNQARIALIVSQIVLVPREQSA